MFVWSPGRVARVADGLTDKRSARAKKILPAGALLWAWDADPAFEEKAGEQWLILLPDKWNRQVHYGWRFDPAQLAANAAMRASRALPHSVASIAHGVGQLQTVARPMTASEPPFGMCALSDAHASDAMREI